MKPSVRCTVPNGVVQDDFLKVYEKMQENVVQRSRLYTASLAGTLCSHSAQAEVCQTVQRYRRQGHGACKLGELWWPLCRCECRMATLCGGSSCCGLSWAEF